ncbi:MBOAT family O-acyltransferase [Butyrivibrio fibrisolvens]|uniref:MBOAT family O-acyltransferase n=1 Tax=Butyrivibrio fibrisolvens TaxID=831 RepID=UPI00048804F4|nr:MBOAT family O-acyltransferase [Butyrivibrio fibrisolvens]
MFFNSYLFILIFLPTFLIAFYLAAKVLDNNGLFLITTAASLIFCASSGLTNAIFILGEIVVNYLFYIALKRNRSKHLLATFITLNVLFLGVFKYTDMAISLINAVLKTNYNILNIESPLGISFITFQQIAFLVYVYKNPDFSTNALSYSTFISFFPHVLSGPILYTEDFYSQCKEKIGKINWDNISSGLLLFSLGMAKKILLADVYGKMVNAGYDAIESLNTGSALFISIAYTLQIYFDFSGYCDMAMGVGKMININIPINFNSPYKAVTIDDFWDRWHMTLTRFLTRHVYIPLGGNRKGIVRTYINIMAVFLISGLWHGASLTFVMWGLVHGLAMIISRLFKKHISRIPKLITKALTFIFVNFAWIIFRAGSFSVMKQMVSAFLRPGLSLTTEVSSAFAKIGFIDINFGYNAALAIAFVIFGLILVFTTRNSLEITNKCKWSIKGAICATLLLIFCVLSFTGTTTYIYLRF